MIEVVPCTIITDQNVCLQTAQQLVGLGQKGTTWITPIYGLWKGEEGRQVTAFVDEEGEPKELQVNHFATEILQPVMPILGNCLILLEGAKLKEDR